MDPRLPVGQPLGTCEVLDPGEAVIPPLIADALLVELPGQPLAAIENHVGIEGEPSLEPHLGQAKPAVVEIEVVMQAFPWPSSQLDRAGLGVAMDVVRGAVLQR